MSAPDVRGFIEYWEAEGADYALRGDYAWMAEQLPGAQGMHLPQRVLEIGCGVGFGTEALIQAGNTVFAIDLLPECLEVTKARVVSERLTLTSADLENLSDEVHAALAHFAPDAVVCWLMGAPQDMTGAVQGDAGQAVAAYRERLHRKVAELAAKLPTVQRLHFVDRTVIPWQAKDLARDTLVRYHLSKTTLDLPWQAVRGDAMYRKMAVPDADLAHLRKSHPALKSAVATLASLCLRRSS
jgi:SAM-dependent methyltransferase